MPPSAFYIAQQSCQLYNCCLAAKLYGAKNLIIPLFQGSDLVTNTIAPMLFIREAANLEISGSNLNSN